MFQKNCTQIAAPIVTTALNKNTVRTKARTRARSYLPNKPDPLSFRFYSVVGWNIGIYLYSVNDNRLGNLLEETPAEAYCNIFPKLESMHNREIKNSNDINPKSTFAS